MAVLLGSAIKEVLAFVTVHSVSLDQIGDDGMSTHRSRWWPRMLSMGVPNQEGQTLLVLSAKPRINSSGDDVLPSL